jgi:PAS domain S-box-containing protein
MDPRSVEAGCGFGRDLRRRLDESQRLVRMLDAQVHVLSASASCPRSSAHGDVGFMVVDASLRIVWTNAFLAKQLNTAADPPSFVGSSCNRALCRRDIVCEGCPATAAFESEATAHRELSLDLDGTPRILYVTAIPVLSPKGSVEQLMIMVQDVSDLEVLRRSEGMLRESESRMRLLVEQMPAVMWSTDRELRFTSFVGSALRNLGLRPIEVVGQTLFEFFGTDDPAHPPIAAHVRAVAGTSVAYAMTWNGRAFDTYVEPLLGPQQEIIGTVGLALDVTERQAAEEVQRQSEARKHAILETSLDAIVIMDHEGRVVEFNPAAETTFGYERSEAVGRSLADSSSPRTCGRRIATGWRAFLQARRRAWWAAGSRASPCARTAPRCPSSSRSRGSR